MAAVVFVFVSVVIVSRYKLVDKETLGNHLDRVLILRV
jgi:hypothetical protein